MCAKFDTPVTHPHYFLPEWVESTDQMIDADVCVYGGTTAGVVAAVTAASRGKQVVVLNPGKHLGGMSSGGLGWTDFGRQHVIGGRSRAFYEACGKHYGKDIEWRFEPKVAERVFEQMIADADIPVHHAAYIEKAKTDGQKIKALRCLGGLTVTARMFIDATYEGDLLAAAGVSFTVGREANAQYDETLNGIHVCGKHQFSHPVDPYMVAGDPSSGLLPGVIAEDLRQKMGEGDHRVQAYNFRVCMTNDPDLKIDWQKPANFDPAQYVLATRWFCGEKDRYNEQLREKPGDWPWAPIKFDMLTNKTPGGYCKTDTNNHGAVSSDFIGQNYDWPTGGYEAREAIFQAHVTYQQGLYWHLANDPVIPERYRDAYSPWGLPRDEFEHTGHWPHQLYVREGRRMVADYVITEHDCHQRSVAEDSVGMGSYNMDSHNCTRFVGEIDGKPSVMNEGDVQVPPTDPYPIGYRAVVPKRGECANLFVPVSISSSHIAFGSARMEPVFMVLGESCGIAAAMCLDEQCASQDLAYDALQPELLNAKQVLVDPTASSFPT